MVSRREFLKKSGLLTSAAVLGIGLPGNKNGTHMERFQSSNRPPFEKRSFVSESVEEKIVKVRKFIADEELGWLFENCFPNTLDTTVRHRIVDGRPDTFIITGDINAMWLRDSSAQVWPYITFCKDDPYLRNLIVGLINRQSRCIKLDPYANAFNFADEGSHWDSDLTDMRPELHERKWELDSLIYTIRLSTGFYEQTKDTSFIDDEWLEAQRVILSVLRREQKNKKDSPYRFQRETPNPYDTLPLGGQGNPSKSCGLVNSSFRPSDDACVFSFHVPSNIFAYTYLRKLSEMLREIGIAEEISSSCEELSSEVYNSVLAYAVVNHRLHGRIFAYEIDGYGSAYLMDDANVPSLLSLKYLGVKEHLEIYNRTRKFVLGSDNPYFFKGEKAEGIGGPHAGLDMIWPMSIIMRGLTSVDDGEIRECLRLLKLSHAGTGFMHESFHKDDPSKFTRSWFAWANGLFGELILKIFDEKPHILIS